MSKIFIALAADTEYQAALKNVAATKAKYSAIIEKRKVELKAALKDLKAKRPDLVELVQKSVEADAAITQQEKLSDKADVLFSKNMAAARKLKTPKEIKTAMRELIRNHRKERAQHDKAMKVLHAAAAKIPEPEASDFETTEERKLYVKATRACIALSSARFNYQMYVEHAVDKANAKK